MYLFTEIQIYVIFIVGVLPALGKNMNLRNALKFPKNSRPNKIICNQIYAHYVNIFNHFL